MRRERRAEFLEREASSRLHGAERLRDLRGDLGLAEPAEVRELDHLTLFRREGAERSSDVARTLGALAVTLRVPDARRLVGEWRAPGLAPRGGRIRGLLGTAAARAESIERSTARDR